MEKKINWDTFVQSAEQNPLKTIQHYNDEMTISQVVKFFERQHIFFTKTMIQNYVRIQLLPPPAAKRFYTQSHLMLLVIINSLKTVFSLEEIKSFFNLTLGETPIDGHTLKSEAISKLYSQFLTQNQSATNMLQAMETNTKTDTTSVLLHYASLGLLSKKIAQSLLNFPSNHHL